jgi:uncharacterized protein (TIGR00255 family)
MQSMTGYGKAASPSGFTRQWAIECTSVNRKQLEVQVVAPRNLLSLEPVVRRSVGTRFHRGRITVSLQETSISSQPKSTVSREFAKVAADDFRALQKELGLTDLLTLELILKHPIFSKAEVPDENMEGCWEQISPVLDQALDALDKMRQREGAELRNELNRLIAELVRVVSQIGRLAPGVPLRHRANLLARIAKAELEKLPDEGRLATEVALFAERCDVTEELARLDSHLAQFAETLESSGPVGRTLEFIVQELFREINTTGSKASDPQISRLVVEAKTLLDQVREQLANVE